MVLVAACAAADEETEGDENVSDQEMATQGGCTRAQIREAHSGCNAQQGPINSLFGCWADPGGGSYAYSRSEGG